MNVALYAPVMSKNTISSFDELICQWPSLGEMATDMGVQYVNVYRWKARNSIPAEYWGLLLDAARRRKIRIGCSDLIALAAN